MDKGFVDLAEDFPHNKITRRFLHNKEKVRVV